MDLSFGARFTFPVNGNPFSFDITYATAPARTLTIAPTSAQESLTLADAINAVAAIIGTVSSKAQGDIDALVNFLRSPPMSEAPWSKLLTQAVTPSLTLSSEKGNATCALVLTLDPPLSIGGSEGWGGFSISIEPTVTINALLLDWQEGAGAKLRASVTFPDQPTGGGTAKPEVVAFPFPIPAPEPAPKFHVYLLAIGQHFAPDPASYINTDDPISTALGAMEKVFASDAPDQLLTALAGDYDPAVGWFVAAHVLLYGFTVKVLFADPGTYGVEITSTTAPLAGGKFEILYTKISPGLGVYYGELTLPTAFQHIGVGGCEIGLPSFALWIYTNGDFRVEVGWPLGPNSISIQFEGFLGSAGFYFGRMRSADVPHHTGPDYDPVVEFGLAVSVGIGASYNEGVISASFSLTITGIVQGLLAWQADSSSKSLWNPDHYWFSGSVGVAGVLQGSVNLAIISASISIIITATVAIAFETGYETDLNIKASVEVEVSIHIVFFTIHIHFSATVSTSFTLSGGANGPASFTGPLAPGLSGFLPPGSGTGSVPMMLDSLADPRLPPAAVLSTPQNVKAYFALQPGVMDSGGSSAAVAVATLAVAKPGGSDASFGNLVGALATFLLATYGPDWKTVGTTLGPPTAQPPAGFSANARSYLAANLTFTIAGVDFGASSAQQDVVLLPMIDGLQMTVKGTPIVFGNVDKTGAHYPQAIQNYFQALAAYAVTADQPPEITSPQEGVARLVFDDYLLMLARSMANDLTGNDAPSAAQVLALAGLGSRMLLHGSRLPDPNKINDSTGPFTEAEISGLYTMTGQQFAAAPGTSVQATLAVPAGNTDPLAKAVGFASGTSATATVPVPATLPPLPAPQWVTQKPGTTPTSSTIAALALKGVARVPALYSAPNGRKLTVDTTSGVLLYLPHGALAQITQSANATPSTTWQVSAWPSPPTWDPATAQWLANGQGTPLAVTLGLLVPIVVAQIPLSNASGAPSASPPPDGGTLPNVYAVLGTDDPTRELIDQALAAPGAVSSTTAVHLLFSDGGGGFTADAKASAVLAKTNLSTDAQPGGSPVLLALRRAGTPPQLGPCSATLGDGADLLRLVWEASVVHTSGYYLHYDDGNGKGLAPSLFKGGRANLWLWVPAVGTTGAPYWNAFTVAPTASVQGTVVVALTGASGPPMAYQPNYLPGLVGFELDWYAAPIGTGGSQPSPFDPSVIGALYHLVSYDVTVSGTAAPLWTLPLSPQDVPVAGDESYSYRSLIPAAALLRPGASPYAAVGQSIALAFRLADVYGNVLAAGLSNLPLTVTYNDPLIPPTAWPYFQLLYRFMQKAGKPTLAVGMLFNPPSPLKSPAQLLTFYTGLNNQLADSNVSFSLTSSLFGTADVDPHGLVLAGLRSVLGQIIKDLKGGGPTPINPPPIQLSVTPASAQIPAGAVVPVGLSLTLTRPPNLVDATARTNLPSVQTVSCDVFPDVNGVVAGASGAGLNALATDFEGVFAGFDGSSGALKLAIQALNQSADAAQDDHLWAVHVGGSGLGVSTTASTKTNQACRCYTMQPFSRTLAYSDTPVTVYTYGAFTQGNFPLTSGSVLVSGLDIDELFNDFLLAIDRILAPDITTYLAAADASGAYASLLGCKWTLAVMLSQRLIPILEGGQPPAASTVTAFQQSLLVALGSAYTTAAAVEFDMTVTPGTLVTPPPPATPQFFGPFATALKQSVAQPYSLSSGRLPLSHGAQTVAMLATVPNAEAAAYFTAQLSYNIGFIQFNFETAETEFGYTPSSWLRFILPPAALDVPLGLVDIPVPLRRYPAAPVIQAQTTTSSTPSPTPNPSDPITQQIEEVLVWPYTLNVNKVDPAPQDEMKIVLTLNGGLVAKPSPGGGGVGDGPSDLVAGLVQFQAAYDSLLPALQTASTNVIAENRALLQILGPMVQVVVDALQPGSHALATDAVPTVETRTSTLIFDEYYGASNPKLTLRTDYPAATALPADVLAAMPTINTATAANARRAPAPDIWETTYTYTTPPTTALAMTWPKLHLLQYQTAIASAQVIRNADIEIEVNEYLDVNNELIYRTPIVTPHHAVVPLVAVTQPLAQTAPFASPAAALNAVFDALLKMVVPLSVTVRIDYRFPISPPPTTGVSLPVMTRVAAVMATGVAIGSSADIGPFVTSLAADVVQWAKSTGPWPTSNAALSLNVALFASITEAGAPTELPLLRLSEVDLPLVNDWLSKT